jgi:hypothetical protein
MKQARIIILIVHLIKCINILADLAGSLHRISCGFKKPDDPANRQNLPDGSSFEPGAGNGKRE